VRDQAQISIQRGQNLLGEFLRPKRDLTACDLRRLHWSLEGDPEPVEGSAGSDIFASRHTPDRLYEDRPGLPLPRQHAPALARHLIEAAPPLAGLFDPGAFNPTALFEPIQQGIQGVDVKRELAFGAAVDQLAELIPVPGPCVEQREDEQLRRSLLQFPIERPDVHICHSQTVYSQCSPEKVDPQVPSSTVPQFLSFPVTLFM
jgi:hypothetical protein